MYVLSPFWVFKQIFGCFVFEVQVLVSQVIRFVHIFRWSDATTHVINWVWWHCWWFRNPASVGNRIISHYLRRLFTSQVVSRISEPWIGMISNVHQLISIIIRRFGISKLFKQDIYRTPETHNNNSCTWKMMLGKIMSKYDPLAYFSGAFAVSF